MSVMEWKKDGAVALLAMTNGENRHNRVFLDEMNQCLDDVEADGEIKALALASNDVKYWSLGLDLEWLLAQAADNETDLLRTFFLDMNALFKRLLTFPMPVIAAIGGHVTANAMNLAAACDFRFMRSDRGFARLPEVDINIPFLPGMIALLCKAFPNPLFDEMQYTGRTFTGLELEARRAVLKTFEGPEALLAGAMEFARSFDKRRSTFGEMKKRANREVIRIMDEEDPRYIDDATGIIGG